MHFRAHTCVKATLLYTTTEMEMRQLLTLHYHIETYSYKQLHYLATTDTTLPHRNKELPVQLHDLIFKFLSGISISTHNIHTTNGIKCINIPKQIIKASRL